MPLDSRHTQGFGPTGTLRTAAQVRDLQLRVAGKVFDDGDDAPSEAEQQVDLSEILQTLGLLRVTLKTITSACGPLAGTLRGYRKHLAAYSTPCQLCLDARQYELDERWRTLGIEQPDQVQLRT